MLYWNGPGQHSMAELEQMVRERNKIINEQREITTYLINFRISHKDNKEIKKKIITFPVIPREDELIIIDNIIHKVTMVSYVIFSGIVNEIFVHVERSFAMKDIHNLDFNSKRSDLPERQFDQKHINQPVIDKEFDEMVDSWVDYYKLYEIDQKKAEERMKYIKTCVNDESKFKSAQKLALDRIISSHDEEKSFSTKV